jgi:MFS family permease
MLNKVFVLLQEAFGSFKGWPSNTWEFLCSIDNQQRYVIFFLFMLYVNNQFCRYIMNYLYAEPSETEFISISMSTNISSFGYGNVIGFGFSLSFVFCGFCVARVVEFYNRKRMLLFGLLVWSMATILLANAKDFGKLMMSRLFLGMGQSVCVPASFALLAQLFPQDENFVIIQGIYGYGLYVGQACISLILLFVSEYGWKSCCHAIGTFSFFLAVVLWWTITEPERKKRVKLKKQLRGVKNTLEDSFKEIYDNNMLIVLFVAGSFRFMAEYVLSSFLPLFFLNKFPEHKQAFAIGNAAIILMVGLFSTLLGTAAPSVYHFKLDKPGCVGTSCTLLLLLVGCTVVGIFAAWLTFLVSSFSLSMFGLFLLYLLTEWWFRPFIFIFQRELTPQGRGAALGYFSFVATLAGSGAATVVGYFIGREDNNLHGNVHVPPKNIVTTLVWTISILFVLSALLFFVSSHILYVAVCTLHVLWPNLLLTHVCYFYYFYFRHYYCY